MSEKVTSANIAFKEEFLAQMLKNSSLKLENKIYGTWAGQSQKGLHDFQDILIFEKVEFRLYASFAPLRRFFHLRILRF